MIRKVEGTARLNGQGHGRDRIPGERSWFGRLPGTALIMMSVFCAVPRGEAQPAAPAEPAVTASPSPTSPSPALPAPIGGQIVQHGTGSTPGTSQQGSSPAPSTIPQASSAELRGLDKTTARVNTFEAPVGQIVHFGTLDILVKDCRKRPPEEEPEVAAYLDIEEQRPGQAQPVPLFHGWMFASSPAVSALEHPVYDVWVLDCKTATGSGVKPD